ncbi:hypothetical protein ACT3TP_09785 [Glutamicibacter sp. AOP38-B1-38]|uniref:hypothetical protein n=1 Tax=Glutamicibacter sp. AOP38-B1-38 TaxID=3457680 RepID=UPI0040339F53
MNADEIRFPTLGNAIAGRLTTGAVKGLLALAVAWLCTWFISVDAAFGKLVIALIVSFVVSEVLGAVIERPIVVREYRAAPGGLGYVLLPLSASVLIAFASAFAVTGAMDAAVLITVIVAVINTSEVLWLRSWEPGPTPEEEQAKFQDFKAMTSEYFAEDAAEIKRQAGHKARERYYKKKARGESKEHGNEGS